MKQKAYINGQFIDGEKSLEIVSPIDLKVYGEVPALSEQHIDEAFKSARNAFEGWRIKDAQERIKYIEKFITILIKNKDNLSEIILNEIGKKKSDGITEIVRTIELIRNTIYEYQNILVKHKTTEQLGIKNKTATILREPLGVVLTISPYNYPVNLSIAKIIPALITGNTVIFKSATNGSIVACELAKYFDEAKFPKGVINVVTGRGREIGDYLTNHNEVDAISYTGSTKVGINISKNSIMKKIVLEMGGKSPAIILSDVNVKETVKKVIGGIFNFSGQRCTSIKRILIDSSIAEEFITEMKRETSIIKTGSPRDEENLVVPLIDEYSAKYQKELINDAIDKGAQVVIGNNIEKNLVYPTILRDVTKDMRIAKEEQFGPILPIIKFKTIAEAIDIANDTEYGLQASIFTADIQQATKIGTSLKMGSININGIPSRGPDILPFTGVKNSGFGVQGVQDSLFSMTRPKNFIINK